MQITILKSKIHHATVTQSSLKYEGSITIDLHLMKKAGIIPYEKVLVANISRGTRFETYAIPGKLNSKVIGLNGATARLGKVGDLLTIMIFGLAAPREATKHKPKILLLDKSNRIKKQ